MKMQGFGIINISNNQTTLIDYGIIKPQIKDTLANRCQHQGHPYKRLKTNGKIVSRGKTTKEWLKALPCWMQALSYLIKQWYLRYRHLRSFNSRKANRFENNDSITIVSYFPNIDAEKIKRGEYWSRYWESLHTVLDKLPIKINWVWFFFENYDLEFKEAVPIRDICNQSQPEKNLFFFSRRVCDTVCFLEGS